MQLILASASPRRRELLRELGMPLAVCPANVDESRLDDEAPRAYVKRLAKAKAHAVGIESLTAQTAIVAADTIVHTACGCILGKPKDADDAVAMLKMLSGATHQVSTGVCVVAHDGSSHVVETAFAETSDVTFYKLSEDEIASYVASGEPQDKAGSYGIQATGRLLVREVHGDYYNIVGLPIARLVRELERLGLSGRGLTAHLLGHRGD